MASKRGDCKNSTNADLACLPAGREFGLQNKRINTFNLEALGLITHSAIPAQGQAGVFAIRSTDFNLQILDLLPEGVAINP